MEDFSRTKTKPIVRQLPLNLYEDDEMNLSILRMVNPSNKNDADTIREALAHRVSTLDQSVVRAARRMLNKAEAA